MRRLCDGRSTGGRRSLIPPVVDRGYKGLGLRDQELLGHLATEGSDLTSDLDGQQSRFGPIGHDATFGARVQLGSG